MPEVFGRVRLFERAGQGSAELDLVVRGTAFGALQKMLGHALPLFLRQFVIDEC